MSALEDVVSWWIGQLRDVLRRGGDAGGRGPALIAEPGGDGVRLLQRRGAREAPLGVLGSERVRAGLARQRGVPVMVRVPPGVVLERTVTLPLATEAALGRVIGYEIDRISPWRPDEVAWAYALERRDKAAGRLRVRVALLPLVAIGSALAALREAGIPAGAAVAAREGAAREGAGPWRFLLGAPDAGVGWRKPAVAVAAGVCAVLAVAAAAVPFIVQQVRLDRVEAGIERLRPAVGEVEALRRRIAAGAGGGDAVTAEAARLGDGLRMIAVLTALLPDDTSLTALGLRQRVVTMTGRSRQAARLIPLLSADPAVHDAAFAAPVTRVEGTEGDQFSIRAEVGP